MRGNKISTKVALVMLSLVGNVSCAALFEPELPEHFPNWSFSFAQPYLYPAFLTNNTYAINEEEDWTSMVHLGRNRNTWKRVNGYYGNSYDGYGLALLNEVHPFQVGSGTNHLPDKLYVEWQRYDFTRYMTVIDVTDKMKTVMKKPHPHPLQWKESCYQTEFAFGLLPNGHVKLWLYGCLIYTYVGEFEPQLTKPSTDEDSYKTYKEWQKHLEEDVGAKAEPIPWDKVNKVWYPETVTVNNLDDL